MATEQAIQAHDRLLNKIAGDFDKALAPVVNDLWVELASIGVTQDRLAVQRAFEPLRSLVIAQVQNLDTVTQSIIDINSDVIDQPMDAPTLEAISIVKTQTQEQLLAQVNEETNKIIEIIVLAAIAGGVSTNLIRQTREELSRARRRIATVFTTNVFEFNTVITRLRSRLAGVKRYRYVGGTIDTTRDFCRRLDGGVFTEQQIQNLWRSRWGGKAPGDPFVVRGGYNCRHHWIPVGETND